ncbi:hypothetical protein JYU34_011578 [Plutella xylostella]|uniref:Mutant cadherin n=1 Tax=Plutella xylostella TaxID=51655 RepID=A0ABQ7QH92_PLUXY|nr:hypothetical protein JYU34_019625 [Plutella xylostella]KAG7304603.1 hypothetical protein JYU34_011578 [Plutella xylostella]
MDDVSLLSLCATSFKEDDIIEAKSLLYEAVSRKKIVRKGEQKINRDLSDIISLLRELDPDVLPIFVARELHKLPPVTFDHIDVTRLLKDIIIIQKELKEIQENYISDNQYATVEELRQLKFEVDKLRRSQTSETHSYVNKNRGAYCLQNSIECDSGPMGFLSGTGKLSADDDVTAADESTTEECERMLSRSTTHATANMSRTSVDEHQMVQLPTRTHLEATHVAVAAIPAVSVPQVEPVCTSQGATTVRSKSFADMVREDGTWKQNPKDEEWQTVQRKKMRNRFAGCAGRAVTQPNDKFRAAETNVPLFVYNVNKDVSDNDVIDFIYSKTQVKVTLERIKTKTPKNYGSFKIFVPKHKIPLFLESTFWPEGVYFRRFFRLKHSSDRFSSSSETITGK